MCFDICKNELLLYYIKNKSFILTFESAEFITILKYKKKLFEELKFFENIIIFKSR